MAVINCILTNKVKGLKIPKCAKYIEKHMNGQAMNPSLKYLPI